MERPVVSIVIPTKNCENLIDKCLASIRNLDYPTDKLEVIVVDGHSTDTTVDIARRHGCKVIYEEGGTIGYARDKGVKNAKGEFVAFTDADCTVDRDWIKELLKHFNNDEIAAVGGPNITPDNDTDFAKCVGVVLSFLSKPGARYGLIGGEVREIYHNPTCNVIYRREMLEEVGGFNHNLVTVDDEELDYRIKKKGYKILYTPNVEVYHYRTPNWKKFAKMAYNYGLGRMQAIKLHRDMGRWFHFAPSFLISVILLFFILSFLNPLFFLITLFILAGGVFGILATSLSFERRSISDFFIYFGLITIWFWGYGFGMFRGLVK